MATPAQPIVKNLKRGFRSKVWNPLVFLD